MLSIDMIKDAVVNLGVPVTAMLVIVFSLAMGWLPVETEATRTMLMTEQLTQQVNLQTSVLTTISQQHGQQIAQHARQLDVLITALRAVCANTARTDDRQRECGNITLKPNVLE